MAISFRRNLLLAVQRESTYNTYISSAQQGFRILPGATLTFVRDIREEPMSRIQAAPSPFDLAAGLRGWRFEFQMSMPKEGMGVWFYHIMGANVTSAVGTYQKHLINPSNPLLGTSATPTSLSLRLIDDNREWQLSGGMVEELKVQMRLENSWLVSVKMIGGSWVDAGTLTAPAYTDAAVGRHHFMAEDFEFWVNQPTGSASNWKATDFELTLARQYADGPSESYESGSVNRVRLESAGTPAFNITGMTRRVYDGFAQFDLMDNYTQFRVEMRATTNGAENIGQVDTVSVYAWKLFLEKCLVVDWNKDESSGIDLQRLDFRATYTAAADMQVAVQDRMTIPANGGTA